MGVGEREGSLPEQEAVKPAMRSRDLPSTAACLRQQSWLHFPTRAFQPVSLFWVRLSSWNGLAGELLAIWHRTLSRGYASRETHGGN